MNCPMDFVCFQVFRNNGPDKTQGGSRIGGIHFVDSLSCVILPPPARGLEGGGGFFLLDLCDYTSILLPQRLRGTERNKKVFLRAYHNLNRTLNHNRFE